MKVNLTTVAGVEEWIPNYNQRASRPNYSAVDIREALQAEAKLLIDLGYDAGRTLQFAIDELPVASWERIRKAINAR